MFLGIGTTVLSRSVVLRLRSMDGVRAFGVAHSLAVHCHCDLAPARWGRIPVA